MGEPWKPVEESARGERSDYALEARPLSTEGGQAVVFRAQHKPSGVMVAVKRLRSTTEDAVARMAREIDIGRKLAGHRHVMPVLDASPAHDWFVMPLAAGNAVAFREGLASQTGALRGLVEAIARGIEPAHAEGWVHRDITPANVLWLADGADGRWVVADWGLGRRPRGDTTSPGRTRVGAKYGTEGFAAPELAVDAHSATPAADVYSLGQVVGWVLTGRWPQANVALRPESGPWRTVVRAATQFEAWKRPSSAGALLMRVAEELDAPSADVFAQAEGLVAAAGTGDDAAAVRLFQLCDGQRDSFGLHVDLLPRLGEDAVRRAVADRPDVVGAVVAALGEHLDGQWDDRDYDRGARVVMLLFRIARAAGAQGDLDVLEAAGEALFAWDAHWDQWKPQDEIRRWLRALSGDEARVVAGALRRHPDAGEHFLEVADDSRADVRIRAAVQPL